MVVLGGVLWETKKWLLVALDRCLSDTVTIVREFAWADSRLVVLEKWSSCKDGHMNMLDCNALTSFRITSFV